MKRWPQFFIITLLLVNPLSSGTRNALATELFPGEDPNHPMFGESRGPLVEKVETMTFTSTFGPRLARDMVKEQGKEYIATHIAKEIKTIKSDIKDYAAFKARTNAQLSVLKDWDSDMHAYVVELAAQLEMSAEDVWVSFYIDAAWAESMTETIGKVWNDRTDLYKQGLQRRGGCTTLGWNNGIIAGNMDFTSTMLGAQKNTKTPDLIFEGEYYGAFRAMGRNVGLIITTLVADTVAHGPDGLPHPIVIASVARRATGVAHAIELLNQIGFESPMSYLLGDKDGGLMVYYAVDGERLVNKPFGGFVAQTNFALQNRDRLLEAWNNDYLELNEWLMQAPYRYDVAVALLRGVPLDERNVDAMKTLLRTQPIQMRSARGHDFGTITSYIMDLPNGCMYQTPDRPDLVEYVKVCF